MFNLDSFQTQCAHEKLKRGWDYYIDGNVELMSVDAGLYSFEVEGSSVYNVSIKLDGTEVISYSCDCPYCSGLCKHVIACLFFLQDRLSDKIAGKSQELPGFSKNKISGLSEEELYYLCYLAFSGCAIDGRSAIPTGGSFASYTQKKQKELNASLLQSGWLKKTQGYYYHYGSMFLIPAEKCLELLKELLENHPAWVKLFASNRRKDYLADFRVQVVTFLLHGESQLLSVSIPEELLSEPKYDLFDFMTIAIENEPRGAELAAAVNPGTIFMIVNHHWLLGKDGDLGEISLAKDILAKCKRIKGLELQHAGIRRDWFFQTAELMPLVEGTESMSPSIAVKAAILLYEGHLDEAIEAFGACKKAQRRNLGSKLFLNDPISLLLYVVALGTRRSDEDVRQLMLLGQKSRRDLNSAFWPVLSLVDFLKDSNQTIDVALKYFLDGKNSIASAIACIVMNIIGMKGDFSKFDGYEGHALLRSEMSFFLPKVSKGQWPYEPIFHKIKKKERWELVMDELISLASKHDQSAEVEESVERMIYVMHYDDGPVEPRVQNKLKNGKWGKGRVLTMTKYRSGDFPMDEMDKAIYSAWIKGDPDSQWRDDFPSLQLVAPRCKGKGKLYYAHGYSEYDEVEVREEKVFITTMRKDGLIHFASNVPGESLQRNSTLLYEWSADHKTLTYWPLSKEDNILFRGMLDLREIPESAEPRLTELLKALNGRVEVQGDVKGAVQLEKKEGSSVVTVRIEPDGDRYKMTILAHPLQDGSCYFRPGHGNSIFIDSSEGTRFEVSRNLAKEKRNRNKVVGLVSYDILASEEYADLGTIITVGGILALLEKATEMQDVFCIEWPEGVPFSTVAPDSSSWEINAVGKGGWFELEGSFNVSEDMVITMAQLLDLYRTSSGGYVRLSDKLYMKLSEQLRCSLEKIDAASEESKGKVRIPELALSVMQDDIDGEFDFHAPKKLSDLRRKVTEAAGMTFQIPEELHAQLRPYQADGFQWMMRLGYWGAGACLADDMGLGKTVQSIAFLLAHASEGPQMVVAPASVVSNWGDELARFAPSLNVTDLNLCPSDIREERLSALGKGSVLITSYGLLVSESEAVSGIDWTTVVLDEAHSIKNRGTKTSAAVMKLKAAYRIALTGTPVQNHLGELWNLFRFTNPFLLGTYEHFAEKFMGKEDDEASSSRDALKHLVGPFILRRTKKEVVCDLPSKEEIIVPVDLSEEEKAAYELKRRKAKEEIEDSGIVTVNALAKITELRIAACSISLTDKGWKGPSSKLEVFIDKLTSIVESGGSVLVFSQFTSFLEMARSAMEAAGIKEYLYLDGSTPLPKRKKMVGQFQRGEQRIFLISLKAGGLGLNLTGANYVIHLDPWWNPAIEQQATDRAYRIGQRQKVTVYHLISRGTIEEKILRLHKTKRQIADDILDGTNISRPLTADEIAELFS